jgi:signal transduction histidine kinase
LAYGYFLLTGLGLSLSYDSIKAHDCELKVEQEGEGAAFVVRLL